MSREERQTREVAENSRSAMKEAMQENAFLYRHGKKKFQEVDMSATVQTKFRTDKIIQYVAEVTSTVIFGALSAPVRVLRNCLCLVMGLITWAFSLDGSTDAVELNMFERRVILPFLKYCSVPRHISFIMDGNRRFAKIRNQHTLVGHRMGYDRLRRVLLWCFELGVEEVSVYAFSMDNFSRTKEEVDYLMDLAETKLGSLCEDNGFVMTNRIRVRVCGEKSLLRPSLQRVIQEVESKTAHHDRGNFNILLAYSSKRELNQAIDKTLQSVPPKDLSWATIESNLYNSTPVDLVVRTSGETRLSDFLVWQLKPDHSVVVFVKHFWPDYSLWDLATSLLKYHYRTS
jgi:ditrans,polycis-polyprenyl diphosphate synthase